MAKMAFGDMVARTRFFDSVSGKTLTKISDTHAQYPDIQATVYIGLADEYEAETPIGYQVANERGEDIQGDGKDPSGYHSYQILSRALVDAVIAKFPAANLQPCAIYADDIEDPEILM